MNKVNIDYIQSQLRYINTRLNFMKDYIERFIEEIENIELYIEEIDSLVETNEEDTL